MFRGLSLVPSLSAFRELEDLILDMNDVREVLEGGFDCSTGKRKEGILERCLRRNGKALRVVVARDFNNFLKRDVWVVVHVSLHSWSRKFALLERRK